MKSRIPSVRPPPSTEPPVEKKTPLSSRAWCDSDAAPPELEPAMPGPALLPLLHARTRAWFETHRRPLPWRVERSPWRVWVSEIMLQQTQVATVIPYFERFLVRFPDVQALADAPQEEILSLWRGLGYYSRARNLQRGAQVVAKTYGGEFPRFLPDALGIPGVGRYTAGAILSLAYQQPVPLLDGNVARVLARLTGSSMSPKTPEGLKHFWSLAADLLDVQHPGAWNEALMELGATLCMPTKAECGECPLREGCVAAKLPDPTLLPIKLEKRARPSVCALGLLIRSSSGAILMARRPDEGLLGGMWEMPGGRWNPAAGIEPEARRLASARLGLPLSGVGRSVEVTHLFTHFRLDLTVVEVQAPEHMLASCVGRIGLEDPPSRKAGVDAVDATWTALELMPTDRLETLPMGKATLKALEPSRWAQMPLALERLARS